MGIKIIANNKKAYHEYFVDEVLEAGLVLQGTEVKSMRLGQVSIKESYCRIRNGEVFVDNMNISPYEQGNRENHDPLRARKLARWNGHQSHYAIYDWYFPTDCQ